jgi:hypothetical protein
MRRFFSWVHAAKKFDPQWTACFLVLSFLARELRGWEPEASPLYLDVLVGAGGKPLLA